MICLNSSKDQDSTKNLKNISVGDLIAIIGVVITMITTGSQLIYSFYQNGRMIYYGIPYFKIIQTDSQTWFFINIFFMILLFFIMFYITRRKYLQKRKQNRALTNLDLFCFLELFFLVFIFFIYTNNSSFSLFQFIISSITVIILQIITYFICKYSLFKGIIKSKERQDQLEYYIEKYNNVVAIFLSTLLTIGIILIAMTFWGYFEEQLNHSYYIAQDNGVDQLVIQTIDNKAILFEFNTNNNTLMIDKSKFKIINMKDITITLEQRYYPKKIFYNN